MEPLDIAIEALDKIRDTSEEFGISRYAAQISGLLRDARQRDRLLIERLHSSKNSLLDANKNC